MKPPALTDHVVLRFLERSRGLDVDAVRSQILAVNGLAEAVASGATRYSIHGLTYVISDRRVITVVPAESPQSSRLGAIKKHGRSVRMRGPAW